MSTAFEEYKKAMEYLDDWLPRETDVPDKKFGTLRPMTFDDFIGQERHVNRLQAAITAAQKTDRPLPHLAFISEAGTGKTSLAACVASAMERTAISTVGSALQDMATVAAMVDHVDGGIAFVDEAHDIAKADIPIMSGLLPLLEDFVLDLTSGSRHVTPFTLIVATTNYGMLDKALRSRLGIPYSFDEYTVNDMQAIAAVHAAKRKIILTGEAADEIAKRARGNPRYCLNLLTECNNIALAAGQTEVTVDACGRTFSQLRIDDAGLTQDDRALLDLLSNGPVALSRCASALGMDKKTYEEMIESFMFRSGYITTNSRGRMLTQKGEDYVRTN